MLKVIGKSLLIAAMFSLAATSAHSGPAASAGRSLRIDPSRNYVPTSRFTLAPFAFVRFCRDNSQDCTPASGDEQVDLTPEKRMELYAVNQAVNRAIRPVNDDPRADIWKADVTSGDCEDFALTKRRKLISAGWPAKALRIAVAETPSGEGHAVLVVKTSQGDLVLDNRHSSVKAWNHTDLRWLKIQSGDNPRLWFDI